MKKLSLSIILMMMPVMLCAQWRVGVTAGFGHNNYTSDKHYLSDMYNEGEGGVTAGVAGQYDIKSWKWLHSRLGVRAEMDFIQKNYNTLKNSSDGTDATLVESRNGFFQVPVMANISFGGENTRLFVNLGGYGNYATTDSEWKRRFNAGGLVGIGGEYSWSKWTVQGEVRGYADAFSTTKDSRKLKTPHYNSTIIFQLALFYNFK